MAGCRQACGCKHGAAALALPPTPAHGPRANPPLRAEGAALLRQVAVEDHSLHVSAEARDELFHCGIVIELRGDCSRTMSTGGSGLSMPEGKREVLVLLGARSGGKA